MVRLQSGEEGALVTLMDRYKGPLYGFLNRRVEDAAADDLFQESWLRVVRARDRFEIIPSIVVGAAAVLYIIAINAN